jgi:hypothetical protein
MKPEKRKNAPYSAGMAPVMQMSSEARDCAVRQFMEVEFWQTAGR